MTAKELPNTAISIILNQKQPECRSDTRNQTSKEDFAHRARLNGFKRRLAWKLRMWKRFSSGRGGVIRNGEGESAYRLLLAIELVVLLWLCEGREEEKKKRKNKVGRYRRAKTVTRDFNA